MDPRAHDGAALVDGAERHRNERADRREDQGRVEENGWCGVGVAGPYRPELAGEGLAGAVAGPGERVDVTALVARDLGDDVRGRTEAVQPHGGCVSGEAERA